MGCRHASADVLSVPGIVEEMGVCIEGDSDPCVAEDAADLCDIEPKIDDQMAGKGMAQIMKSQWRPAFLVEPSRASRPLSPQAQEQAEDPGGLLVVVQGERERGLCSDARSAPESISAPSGGPCCEAQGHHPGYRYRSIWPSSGISPTTVCCCGSCR